MKWISIEEFIPSSQGDVLVCLYFKKEKKQDIFVGYVVDDEYYDDSIWFIKGLEGSLSLDNEDDNIILTHWAPLPKLPDFL